MFLNLRSMMQFSEEENRDETSCANTIPNTKISNTPTKRSSAIPLSPVTKTADSDCKWYRSHTLPGDVERGAKGEGATGTIVSFTTEVEVTMDDPSRRSGNRTKNHWHY